MAKKSRKKRDTTQSKIKINPKKSLRNISPFHFGVENSFIYNIKFYNDFKIYRKS